MTTGHDLSSAGATGLLDALASRALAEYGSSGCSTTLLNVSENATFLVERPETGRRTVLRVHRRGYHGERQIASELAWLDALRDEAGLRTPGSSRPRADAGSSTSSRDRRPGTR